MWHWCVLRTLPSAECFISCRTIHSLTPLFKIGDLLEVFTSFRLIDEVSTTKNQNTICQLEDFIQGISTIFFVNVFFASRQIYGRMEQKMAKREELGQNRD